MESPLLAIALHGRGTRCPLLAPLAETKGATAEEHGKLCADRKRVTEQSFQDGTVVAPALDVVGEPAPELISFTDIDGCPFYHRLLQTDLRDVSDRIAAKLPSPQEFDAAALEENLCPYELAKRLAGRARVVVAAYPFFFHPRVRDAVFSWMGVPPSSVDLVLDEAHGLPDQLRDLSSVSLPFESVRRARTEVVEQTDFSLPDGPSALHLLEAIQAELDEILSDVTGEEGKRLPDPDLLDRIAARCGTDSVHLDAWLAELVRWGESLRTLRRRDRRLPRSWVHSVALTLLSWPTLRAPEFVKVAVRSPRRAVEAFAVDARPSAKAIGACHLSAHLSSALAPVEEYRDALGLGPATQVLSVPSYYAPDRRRFLYDAAFPVLPDEALSDPVAMNRWADRLAEILQCLPSHTLVIFPHFELMERALTAGLSSALPPHSRTESRKLALGDLWEPSDGVTMGPDGPASVLLGVAGGRIIDGIDFRDAEFQAVVLAGLPVPRRSSKRDAMSAFLDTLTPGSGYAGTYESATQRAVSQALGRLIHSEHGRGLFVIMDHRGEQMASVLPGIEPFDDLYDIARRFYGLRARFVYEPRSSPEVAKSDPRNG
jgi:Rad3-related DNA helicase